MALQTLDLWSLVRGRPQIDPRDLADAVVNQAAEESLDYRTRLLIRDSVEALRAYRMSLRVNPANASVLKNAANASQRLGRPADMIDFMNQLRRVAPQDPDVQRVFHAQQPIASHP